MRLQMLRKLKKQMSSLVEGSETERHRELIYFYQQFSFTTNWDHTNSTNHAIGVRQINGQSYIFDSGRKSAIKLDTVYDIAYSLGQCCDWYEFDIIICLLFQFADNINSSLVIFTLFSIPEVCVFIHTLALSLFS